MYLYLKDVFSIVLAVIKKYTGKFEHTALLMFRVDYKQVLLQIERLYFILLEVEALKLKLSAIPTGAPLREQVSSGWTATYVGTCYQRLGS